MIAKKTKYIITQHFKASWYFFFIVICYRQDQLQSLTEKQSIFPSAYLSLLEFG